MATMAGTASAIMRAARQEYEYCQDYECGGNQWLGCEPYKHFQSATTRLYDGCERTVSEPDGEEYIIYKDGSALWFDNINDNNWAEVLRGRGAPDSKIAKHRLVRAERIAKYFS